MPNCVARRHVDASRDLTLYAARLLFSFFFSCSADYERDWLSCKVVSFELANNTLHVKNKSNSLYFSS